MKPAIETNDILERLYGDPDNKRAFLNKAARFFGRYETQSRLGLDANALVSEAFTKIAETGFPDGTVNHAAYVMKVIERQGIQRVSRRGKYNKAEQERAASDLSVPEPSFEESSDDALYAARVAEDVRDIVEQLPTNQRNFAEAKIADPSLTDQQIADQQGLSRSSVSRAKVALRANNELSDLHQEKAATSGPDERTTNLETPS